MLYFINLFLSNITLYIEYVDPQLLLKWKEKNFNIPTQIKRKHVVDKEKSQQIFTIKSQMNALTKKLQQMHTAHKLTANTNRKSHNK